MKETQSLAMMSVLCVVGCSLSSIGLVYLPIMTDYLVSIVVLIWDVDMGMCNYVSARVYLGAHWGWQLNSQ